MTTIIAHVGDLHVNSSVALMPPEVHKDDGQTVLASETQRWLWSKWLSYWKETAHYKKKTGGKVIGVINGDWGDMNKHSGFQLVEQSNPDTVINMMIATVAPMRKVCDEIVVIRGTEAHTGGSGWLENRAAQEIGAVRNENDRTWSWYIWEAEIDGVKLTSSHHPGTNSMRPWTAGNEANRRAVIDIYNYAGRDWCPKLTLWGHFHHDADSGDTHPIRAIYNRAWQVKTSFVYRIGLATQADQVGGLWVFCHDGKAHVLKREYQLPRPKAWKQN